MLLEQPLSLTSTLCAMYNPHPTFPSCLFCQKSHTGCGVLMHASDQDPNIKQCFLQLLWAQHVKDGGD